jgi:protein SCO1
MMWGTGGPIRGWCAAVVVVGVLAFAACTDEEPKLPGTLLERTPAPAFSLQDHAGRTVTLDGLRGKAVVLTFMYTRCPDFCPATAAKLRQTLELLGKDAGQVAAIAVSVDPEHDTVEAAREFSARMRMPESGWHYLIGTEPELTPVWQGYFIGRTPPAVGQTSVEPLGHTEALFLIDSSGQRRSLLRGDFDPAELAKALRALAR